MIEWYNFYPADTLFIRGAEPMNLGENHTASANFPPPVSTIAGAIRTACLKQNSVDFIDYKKNRNIDQKIIDAIGKAGDPPPFEVLGPLFSAKEKIFFPAPYSWFMEKQTKEIGKRQIYKCKYLQSSLIKVKGSKTYWTKSQGGELESLGGKWIDFSALDNKTDSVFYLPNENDTNRIDKHENILLENEALFGFESRTGIALKKNRGVREHRLYSFSHARLNSGVSLLLGLSTDTNIPLNKDGVLTLGGEQRFGHYQKDIKFPTSSIGMEVLSGGTDLDARYMSLSMLPANDDANQALVATGKPLYLGGWDLKKRFHKPMQGIFPAGTVFNEKINSNFIDI